MRLSLSKLSLLASVGVGAVALLSAQAGAGDHPLYISMFGGASMLNDVNTIKQEGGGQQYTVGFNTGYILGGAIGMQVSDELRTEIELSHAAWGANRVRYMTSDGGVDRDAASGTLNATYLLANLWIDVPNNGAFKPYVGGGLGVGFANANVPFSGDENDGMTGGGTGFAFQVGGGIRKALSEKIDLDVGYRFKGITGINFGSLAGEQHFNGANIYSHNLQLGLTFHF